MKNNVFENLDTSKPKEKPDVPPFGLLVRRRILYLVAAGVVTLLLSFFEIFYLTLPFEPRGAMIEDYTFSVMMVLAAPSVAMHIASSTSIFVIPFCLLIAFIFSLTNGPRDEKRKAVLNFVCIAIAIAQITSINRYMRHVVYAEAFQNAYSGVIETAQPIIGSIEAYNIDHGSYPVELEVLVPEYLAEIPSTGLAGHPEFDYFPPKDPRILETDGNMEARYQLLVQTPIGPMNADMFFYWPDGDYTDILYANGIEKIGDWAYLHE